MLASVQRAKTPTCRASRAVSALAACTLLLQAHVAFQPRNLLGLMARTKGLTAGKRSRLARAAEGIDASDWQEFRARLVQQEQEDKGGISQKKAEKWAYEMPVIEQGSILLSAPNDHFAINQQYFHKNVIFLVTHTDAFTKGVIINRPTAFSTADVETTFKTLRNFSHEGANDWNVWCGGDCQGINERSGRIPPEYSVLHGLKSLAGQSKKVTEGVYLIDLRTAKELVAAGGADRDDFLLLVGYCGWGPGQLQAELDRSNAWTMASIDPRTLLGDSIFAS